MLVVSAGEDGMKFSWCGLSFLGSECECAAHLKQKREYPAETIFSTKLVFQSKL